MKKSNQVQGAQRAISNSPAITIQNISASVGIATPTNTAISIPLSQNALPTEKVSESGFVHWLPKVLNPMNSFSTGLLGSVIKWGATINGTPATLRGLAGVDFLTACIGLVSDMTNAYTQWNRNVNQWIKLQETFKEIYPEGFWDSNTNDQQLIDVYKERVSSACKTYGSETNRKLLIEWFIAKLNELSNKNNSKYKLIEEKTESKVLMELMKPARFGMPLQALQLTILLNLVGGGLLLAAIPPIHDSEAENNTTAYTLGALGMLTLWGTHVMVSASNIRLEAERWVAVDIILNKTKAYFELVNNIEILFIQLSHLNALPTTLNHVFSDKLTDATKVEFLKDSDTVFAALKSCEQEYNLLLTENSREVPIKLANQINQKKVELEISNTELTKTKNSLEVAYETLSDTKKEISALHTSLDLNRTNLGEMEEKLRASEVKIEQLTQMINTLKAPSPSVQAETVVDEIIPPTTMQLN